MWRHGPDRYTHNFTIRAEPLSLPIYWAEDQWAVTAYGIEATDGTYYIKKEEVGDWHNGFEGLIRHMSGKNWVNTAEFQRAITAFRVVHNPIKERKAKERARMGRSLRFEILKRDGFKCGYCGKSAGETELHVDHIHPIARGGKTERSNLKTACIECNTGKGARVIA